MKHLLAVIFVTIFLPLGANGAPPSYFYCDAYFEGGPADYWTETCTEMRADGTKIVCFAEYEGTNLISRTCEEK